MNFIRTAIIALVGTLASFSPLHANEAVQTFKKDLANVGAFFEEAKPKNSAEKLIIIRQACAKLKAVKTEGLPADLKAAYGDLVIVVGKAEEALKEFPEKAQEVSEVLQKKNADPAAKAEFGKKMQVLRLEANPLTEKFLEACKKYGLGPADFGTIPL